METTSILLIAGFVICFILLFVFIAKYHSALEDEADLEGVEGLNQVTVGQEPTFQPRAALLQSAQAPAALEVADLKEQVKTLHYQLQEFKATTQKHESDIAKQLARLETRIATFEQEYVNKLQPTLLRVIDELEHLKGGEDIVSSTQEEPSAQQDEEIPA